MKTIGYEGKYRVRPNYRRIAKTIGIIYLILAIWSPVMVIRHFKAIGKFTAWRSRQSRIAWIRETRGDTIASWYEAKLQWQDFGDEIKKGWKNISSIF